MTDKKNHDAPPTPIAPLSPLSEQPKDEGVMEYYAYNAADRLKYVKNQIEEREKAHFNLFLIQVSLTGNPERGVHRENAEDTVPCICRDCELPRVTKMLASMVYAISQLKAIHSSLT